MENKLPNRKNPRLKCYDYSKPGAYFVTICTHNKKKSLSNIVGAIHESPSLQLTVKGEIVDDIIKSFPESFGVRIDRYIIMPNHIHLIMIISDSDVLRAIRESPLHHRSALSKAVGYIKMNASKKIHKQFGITTVWQRSFYDHIIRDKDDYEKIAKYMYNNPKRWQFDCFNVPDQLCFNNK